MRSDCDPHLFICFSGWNRRCTADGNPHGRGQPGGRTEDSCQLLCYAAGTFCRFDGIGDCISGADADVLWCERADLPLCKQLSDLLCDGYGVCHPDGRTQPVHHLPGLCQRGDADHHHRSGDEYYPGPYLHLCFGHGCHRCSDCYRSFAGVLLPVCPVVFVQRPGTRPHQLPRLFGKNYAAGADLWLLPVYHHRRRQCTDYRA